MHMYILSMMQLRRREGNSVDLTCPEGQNNEKPKAVASFLANNNHCRRSRRTRWALPTVGLVVIIWMVLRDMANWPNVSLHYTLAPCTFEDLSNAFPPRRNGNPTSPHKPPHCWSLEENIIRIPSQAIVNRHALTPLGSGNKGGVYKAVITLRSSQCVAALKTDHCRNLWTGGPTSCVNPWAIQTRPESFWGSEYTGAVVYYYSAVLKESTLAGLLPTWAVVHGPPVVSWLPHAWWRGAPHTDSTIIGVLMPLQSNFHPMVKGQGPPPHIDMRQTARTLLPAARGLEYVHSLGLVFQDIVEKNVAVDYEHNLSFYLIIPISGWCRRWSCRLITAKLVRIATKTFSPSPIDKCHGYNNTTHSRATPCASVVSCWNNSRNRTALTTIAPIAF